MNCKRILAALLLALALPAGAAAAQGYAPLPIDDTPGLVADAANYLPDNAGYRDETLSVRIETMRAYDTEIMLAYVDIVDPSQIRTAMTGRYGSKDTALPRVMASRSNAVFAVNGDYFNYRREGYLVRQGKLYRERPDELYDMLIIDDKGDFTIIRDPNMEKVQAFEGTMVNTFNFGPALVVDGEQAEMTKRPNMGINKKTQRMAACQIAPLSYLFVATEGPENEGSAGLTMPELAELTHSLGAQQAYNLDGGSSSAMVLGGEKINALSARKVRPICDILYFSTLVPEE